MMHENRSQMVQSGFFVVVFFKHRTHFIWFVERTFSIEVAVKEDHFASRNK